MKDKNEYSSESRMYIFKEFCIMAAMVVVAAILFFVFIICITLGMIAQIALLIIISIPVGIGQGLYWCFKKIFRRYR